MRLPTEELVIKPTELMDGVDKLVDRLREMQANGEIHLEQEVMNGSLSNIIKKGIANLGIYHARLPLRFNDDGDLESQDIQLLFFYHNRLEGYELHKVIR